MPSSFKRLVAVTIDHLLVFIIAFIFLKILGFFINPMERINNLVNSVNSNNNNIASIEAENNKIIESIIIEDDEDIESFETNQKQNIIIDNYGIMVDGKNIVPLNQADGQSISISAKGVIVGNGESVTIIKKDTEPSNQKIIMKTNSNIKINGQNIVLADELEKNEWIFDALFDTLIGVFSAILTDLLYFLLVPIFWYKMGKTPGKIIFNYKVVDFETKEDVTLGQSFLRALGYILCGFTMGIGFLMIPLRKDKRGLHDLISDTCVIIDEKSNSSLQS